MKTLLLASFLASTCVLPAFAQPTGEGRVPMQERRMEHPEKDSVRRMGPAFFSREQIEERFSRRADMLEKAYKIQLDQLDGQESMSPEMKELRKTQLKDLYEFDKSTAEKRKEMDLNFFDQIEAVRAKTGEPMPEPPRPDFKARKHFGPKMHQRPGREMPPAPPENRNIPSPPPEAEGGLFPAPQEAAPFPSNEEGVVPQPLSRPVPMAP